jgi:hypothetical protein
VVNDKAAATFHPSNAGRGYDVHCAQCGPDRFHSLWYDVAERFADMHADASGHETDVVESKPADG